MNVTGRVWQGLALQRSTVALDEVPSLFADPTKLTWVDLADPDEAAVTEFAATLGVDAPTLEDVFDPDERVKIHRYANHWIITAYTTRLEIDASPRRGYSSRLVTGKASALVFPRGVVTIHARDDFDPLDMAARWSDEPAQMGLGVGVLVHAFLDTVVDNHFATMQVLDEVVDDTEEAVFTGQLDQRMFPEQVHQVRLELTQMRRVVLPMREIVASIQRHRILAAEVDPGLSTSILGGTDHFFDRAAMAQHAFGQSDVRIAPGLEPLFDDLYDHVLRAIEWTDSLRDLVSSIFETSLSLQNARLNEVMKKLAGWAAIIAVPTAITGWFGQNIPYWGFADVSGLVASVALIVVLGGGLYLILRHYDWI